MRNNNKLLAAGNAAQIEKLNLYSHKPGFDLAIKNSFKDLDRLLKNECVELDMEINGVFSDDMDIKAIRLEAADVANFAHFIIMKCDDEIKKVLSEKESKQTGPAKLISL